MNIYACDDFDCNGDKKYVGFYWSLGAMQAHLDALMV